MQPRCPYNFFLAATITLWPIFTWDRSRHGMLQRLLTSPTFKKDWNRISNWPLYLIASEGTQIRSQILWNLKRSFNARCVICPHPICRLQKQIRFSPPCLPLPLSSLPPTPQPQPLSKTWEGKLSARKARTCPAKTINSMCLHLCEHVCVSMCVCVRVCAHPHMWIFISAFQSVCMYGHR